MNLVLLNRRSKITPKVFSTKKKGVRPSQSQQHLVSVEGGGGGGGGSNLRGNCGTGVRARISKTTPFIYLAFEKKGPFIYCWPIHILSFDFYAHP